MKRILLFTLLIWGTVLFGPSEGISAGPPPVGGILPEWTLDVPKDGAEKSYLGLSGAGVFKIPQIRAKTVIIEILSMYSLTVRRRLQTSTRSMRGSRPVPP